VGGRLEKVCSVEGIRLGPKSAPGHDLPIVAYPTAGRLCGLQRSRRRDESANNAELALLQLVPARIFGGERREAPFPGMGGPARGDAMTWRVGPPTSSGVRSATYQLIA
jgi:hypothetical protein